MFKKYSVMSKNFVKAKKEKFFFSKKMMFFTGSAIGLSGYTFFSNNAKQQVKQPLTTDDVRNFENAFISFNKGQYASTLFQLHKLSYNHASLKEVLILIESENFTDARKRADEFFACYPVMEGAYHVVLSTLYAATGQPAQAKNYIDKAIMSGGNNPNGLIYNSAKYCKSVISQNFSSSILYPKISLWAKQYQIIDNLDNLKDFVEQNYLFEKGNTNSKNKINIMRSPENRVTFRAWLPKNDIEVGHVSLETDKHYISFWPSESKVVVQEIISVGTGRDFKTFDKDLIELGRMPETRISFYSLDTNAINQVFEEIKISGINWHILGSVMPAHYVKRMYDMPITLNCCSLTEILLYAGDEKSNIYKEPYYEIAKNAVTTPRNWAYGAALAVFGVPAAFIVGPDVIYRTIVDGTLTTNIMKDNVLKAQQRANAKYYYSWPNISETDDIHHIPKR